MHLTSSQYLILFGGGPRPRRAVERFVARARSTGGSGPILVIAWASEEPEASYKSIRREFISCGATHLTCSHEPPVGFQERDSLLTQLASASGIFFTGGDQNRIMDVLDVDQELAEAIRACYRKGVVFGGTSAGTAIMSPEIICGDMDPGALHPAKVGVRKGLGLLPDVILDQHFMKRQRQNRLFAVVLAAGNGALGVGIDEGAALAVSDGAHVEVIGQGQVMMVCPRTKPGSLMIDVLKSGEAFRLGDRARISGSPAMSLGTE